MYQYETEQSENAACRLCVMRLVDSIKWNGRRKVRLEQRKKRTKASRAGVLPSQKWFLFHNSNLYCGRLHIVMNCMTHIHTHREHRKGAKFLNWN